MDTKKTITRDDLLKYLKKTSQLFKILNNKTSKALRNYYNEDIPNIQRDKKLDYLYPNVLDPEFNHKIYKRKEFHDLKFEEFDENIEEEAEKLCNAEFDLSVHQIFVRNFLSFLTPYNSLLLYHGLGTGKTCSAITVCEEMRDYMKQMGIKKKIIIVASPNVQENFKTQLFDERKLKLQDGIWNIRACTGNKFIKEINPMNMKGLTKEKIVLQVKRIIKQSYVFMGYIEFSNYITSIKNKYTIEGDKEDINIKMQAIKKEFSNRLIVIDEVHNLRISGDSPNKKIGQNLLDMVKYSDTLKLLLLSATPMFNSHKEIVWLLNLMNLNDGRPTIELKEVFDTKGNLKVINGREVGKELLVQMMNGYVSYVRGENPYTFPYRIFPKEFDERKSIKNNDFEYPSKQINGKTILQGIEHIDIYLNTIGEYQKYGYDYAIERIKRNLPDSTEMETGMGWQNVEGPLQTLNFVYPNVTLDKYIAGDSDIDLNPRDYIGKAGLNSVMLFNESKKKDFEYSERTLKKYGKIFSQEEIGKYSKKLENLMINIKQSKGIVLVYSQYIDGGCVPIALALEQIGITRYNNRSLFKDEPVPKIDAITMKPKSEMKDASKSFKPARYIMITGDSNLSPNNAKEVKAATNESNLHGEDVKVIIISKAGTEGIDFNNIRQVHLMEPWYNMSRQEQTIGRAVRFRSHCRLPFVERNTEIYLYGTKSYDEENTEPIDLYIYRNAEIKALQVGIISRIMKEHAIDCYLTTPLNELDERRLNANVKLLLSSGKKIDYKIGDKPYTQICDYMESCSYKCLPEVSDSEKMNEDTLIKDTYDENFIQLNIEKVMQKIKSLFKTRFIMSKKQIILYINQIRTYPLIQINSALDYLINDKNEFLIDMFGNTGHLVNIGEYYMFQPLEINETNISRYDRMKPIDYKPKALEINLEKDVKEYIVSGVEKYDVIKTLRYKELLEIIEKNYEKATTKQTISRGEKNWYIHCSKTIERLEEMIDKELLKEFVLRHIIDSLDVKDKKYLIETLLIKEIEKLNVLERKIKNYLDSSIQIENNGNQAYILVENKKLALYIVNSEHKLEKAKPLDIKDFKQQMRELIISKDKYNFIIGFLINVRSSKDIVFKTKEVDLKRNMGARCDQAGKKTIIKILNKITNSSDYTSENTSSLKTPQMCSEQEFLLRYYQEVNKDDKVWFLNNEMATLNEIETLSR
jgi:hypothetical protein